MYAAHTVLGGRTSFQVIRARKPPSNSSASSSDAFCSKPSCSSHCPIRTAMCFRCLAMWNSRIGRGRGRGTPLSRARPRSNALRGIARCGWGAASHAARIIAGSYSWQPKGHHHGYRNSATRDATGPIQPDKIHVQRCRMDRNGRPLYVLANSTFGA